MAAEPDALRLEAYRRQVAASLAFHRARVDRGLTPACGLRLMTADSATVVPNSGQPGEVPFATFSSDSRETDFYAVACEAAKALIEYAASPAVQPAAGREEIAAWRAELETQIVNVNARASRWRRSSELGAAYWVEQDEAEIEKTKARLSILAATSTPAQASGEPVAWAVQWRGGTITPYVSKEHAERVAEGRPLVPLYAHPPAQASESGAIQQLNEVYQHFLAGDLYEDHDRASELLGKMRRAIAALSAPQAAPGEGEGEGSGVRVTECIAAPIAAYGVKVENKGLSLPAAPGATEAET